MEKQAKNTLSLRLTESAVFLRTRPGRRAPVEDSQPAMLRGLLVLDLVKPTRVTSIELDLEAKSTVSWPEGFGARRVEVTEAHTAFQTSVVYFRTGEPPLRRPTSVGPGVLHDNYEDWELPSPSHPPARPSSLPARRASVDGFVNHATEPYNQYTDVPIPPYSPIPYSPIPLSPEPSPGPMALSPSSSLLHPPQSENDIQVHRRSRSAFSSLQESSNFLLQSRQNANLLDPLEQRARSAARSSLNPVAPWISRRSSQDSRSESQSRFSLASMSNAFMGVMKRVHSMNDNQTPQSRGRTLQKDVTAPRDHASESRGRMLDRTARETNFNEPPRESKERSTFGMITDLLNLDLREEQKEYGSNWKEFKKGTYTYPISITIPGHCPPTLSCYYGNVTWSLKAVVHRPGVFKSKLTAAREVIVVACPTDDDTEEIENILVERHWDNQLQYLISVAGRSFYIGGTMPVSFTLLPLAKVKIHKITVCIEERVDYCSQMNRVVRSDPLNRIILLSIKGEGKGGDHILPLESDDVDAFKNSPLYNLMSPDDDPSEVIASMMGPGPWTFHQDLQLPSSCHLLRFTNKNKWSNISIAHTLKWIFRVESTSDLHIDPKTGKKKLFDIVVQAPVHLLSCRCNPDWTALPGYSDRIVGPHSIAAQCPCELKNTKFRRPSVLNRVVSKQSSESSASTAETSSVDALTMGTLRQDLPTLLQATSQYDRLVSGQETETGEVPPAYGETT